MSGSGLPSSSLSEPHMYHSRFSVFAGSPSATRPFFLFTQIQGVRKSPSCRNVRGPSTRTRRKSVSGMSTVRVTIVLVSIFQLQLVRIDASGAAREV